MSRRFISPQSKIIRRSIVYTAAFLLVFMSIGVFVFFQGRASLCGVIDPKDVVQLGDNGDKLQQHLISNTVMFISSREIERRDVSVYSSLSYGVALLPDNQAVFVGTPISFCTTNSYFPGQYHVELRFTDLHDKPYHYSWDISIPLALD